MINMTAELIATSNIDVVASYLNSSNCSLIYCGDVADVPEEFMKVNAITGTAFVPDYDCLQHIVNGDEAAFLISYKQYLNSTAATTLMCTIIKALMVGKNIILYFPKETLELGYPSVLMSFILSDYGIQVKTNSTSFIFNMAYNDMILGLLAQYNLISFEDMFLNLIQLPHITDLNIEDICFKMKDALKDNTTNVFSISTVEEATQYIQNGIQILKARNNPTPAFGSV